MFVTTHGEVKPGCVKGWEMIRESQCNKLIFEGVPKQNTNIL